ncbi:MFS transporter [Clostridium taeniosporum]|uniref:MFS transporter n=1 Tax=Clostridium taeniosporum TaxID=394958 RepID=A0A1D7XJ80_9CLOT|nr:MFS transporter [Clostridium taeniosporum]AOR23391.1 MFS transporter [Clostridium taeniosporum]
MNLIKNKDFCLIIVGNFVSLLGTQMLEIALSLYILKTTGSATKFASVLSIALIPMLLLGPIGGVFVDWFNRKKIIVLLDFLSGISILYYAFEFWINKGLTINQIYLLTIILSTISAIFNPAMNTVIPSVVKKEQLLDANGIHSVSKNTANFLGPMIAGTLFGFCGLLPILILDSASFFISSFSEMFISIPLNVNSENIGVNRFIKDFKEGLAFIKNKKILMNIIIMGLIINFACSPIFSVGFNYISKIDLGVSDYEFGVLNSIIMMAAFFAPILCKIVSKKFKLGKILFLDIFIVSLMYFVVAFICSKRYLGLFSTNSIPYISLVVVGFILILVVSTGNLALNVIIQKETPILYLGRINSVLNTSLMAAIPIGQMIFGVLFDKYPSSICVIISAVILFITVNLFKRSLFEDES